MKVNPQMNMKTCGYPKTVSHNKNSDIFAMFSNIVRLL